MTTLITSTHSFHFRQHPLFARSFDLGEGFGATLNISDNNLDTLVTIFLDDKEYCDALAEAINAVAAPATLTEEAA